MPLLPRKLDPSEPCVNNREARIPHTDVVHWYKYWTGQVKNPEVWRRILYGPGKDPYTGYFIY